MPISTEAIMVKIADWVKSGVAEPNAFKARHYIGMANGIVWALDRDDMSYFLRRYPNLYTVVTQPFSPEQTQALKEALVEADNILKQR